MLDLEDFVAAAGRTECSRQINEVADGMFVVPLPYRHSSLAGAANKATSDSVCRCTLGWPVDDYALCRMVHLRQLILTCYKNFECPVVHNVHHLNIVSLLLLQVVNVVKVFDPYVAVDIDEIQVARTQTRQKTLSPVWNEEMNAKVHSGENINFTVFHDAAIPPDEFVANCKVPFEDIVGQKTSDIWVMLVNVFSILSFFH